VVRAIGTHDDRSGLLLRWKTAHNGPLELPLNNIVFAYEYPER
jgi:hypothetical protein